MRMCRSLSPEGIKEKTDTIHRVKVHYGMGKYFANLISNYIQNVELKNSNKQFFKA